MQWCSGAEPDHFPLWGVEQQPTKRTPIPQNTDVGRQALTGDVYLVAANRSVQLLVIGKQMVRVPITFFVSEPNFTKFFSSNRGWNVVDQVLFRFSLRRSFFETFAIKVQSCQKSRQFWTFLPSEIWLRALLQDFYPDYHARIAARRLVKFTGLLPLVPKS